MSFLPVTKQEVELLGRTVPDVVCVTGDAYVDHPAFGIAIIARVLEAAGLCVAVLSRPNFNTTEDFMRFGKPRYGFFVTGGNLDSMVCNYTAAKRIRSDDPYAPHNKAGGRPDRATSVYSRKIREAYPDAFIVIGGLEASLRRFAHYDYWEDAVRPSELVASGADLLVYGMGERATGDLVELFKTGDLTKISDMRGVCYLTDANSLPKNSVTCAGFEKVGEDKESYAKATKIQIEEHDAVYGRAVVQKHGESYLVQTPPARPLAQAELDRVFELPFTRTYHPMYQSAGGIKALEEIEFSVMYNRGCFGFCNFCAIATHQGRSVTARSHESVIKEVESYTQNPGFKGYVHDVGGPTANFGGPSCEKQKTKGLCRDRKCLGFSPCPALLADQSTYLELLRKLRGIKGVKKIFVRSGIRYDYLLKDRNQAFLNELVEHHVSGQLKVAPEHSSARVLRAMGKPPIEVYKKFSDKFYAATKKVGKKQYLVPYLMSSHPGSTVGDALDLALFLKKNNMRPEQVQDFYPTPGTISTCMYFTGIDPTDMSPIYVPRTSEEKALQRSLLQYYLPQNRRNVVDAIRQTGKHELVGTGPDCLIAPGPDTDFIKTKVRTSAHTPVRGRPAGVKKTPGNQRRKKARSK